jgi:hypothetical protein
MKEGGDNERIRDDGAEIGGLFAFPKGVLFWGL